MPYPNLLRFLKPLNIKTIVDVGASDGRISKDLWEHFPEATYILIDPLVYPNQWTGHNVFWIHKGLHRSSNKHIPFVKTEDPFRSGFYDESESNCNVETTTLTDVCNGCDGIFLKLDTHGVELDILDGHLQYLRSKILAVQIEVYNFDLTATSPRFAEMVTFMEQCGYRVVTLLDTLDRGDGALWQMDLLFVHSDAPYFDRNDYFYPEF